MFHNLEFGDSELIEVSAQGTSFCLNAASCIIGILLTETATMESSIYIKKILPKRKGIKASEM